jgi:putative nucleotidyltransferase with HDIG domain
MELFFKDKFKAVLDKIESKELREQTVKAWIMSAKEGGWSMSKIESIPFTLLTETEGITLIEHTLAVTFGAEGLAKALLNNYQKMPFEIDFDLIYAGGLLHDVGKLTETELVNGKYQKSFIGKCTRHPISGAIIAAKLGMSNEIINIIANHAKEGEGRPQRIETVLIHQADFATFNPMVMKTKGLLIE